PGIWLRCVLSDQLDDFPLDGVVPIFYLPGVSRQDLRAVDTCPDHLKPLAELQYRGVIWSQVNAKDWTVLAFLQTHQGGLNLDVAQDKETKTAMQLALPSLLDAKVSRFEGKRLDKDDFYQLISKDPPGELLRWLNEGDEYQQRKTADEWHAFVELCRYHFAFDPATEGLLSGARKLAEHQGVWEALWERYREVAQRYQQIPERIRQVKPPSNTIDWLDPSSDFYEGWPQWNQQQEDKLREALRAAHDKPQQEAQNIVLELERAHGHRREMIWSELGDSPLANALYHLKILAEVTSTVSLAGGTLEDISNGYQTSGWQADNSAIQALSAVSSAEDMEVINHVLDAIYRPWLMASARYLQELVDQSNYPGGSIQSVSNVSFDKGTCVFFIDALRFDIGKRLVQILENNGFSIREQLQWTALPSVTATGKPAVSPIRHLLTGQTFSIDFEPEIIETERRANHANHMKLLETNGWQVLKGLDTGDPSGKAWTEIKAIDDAGHDGTLTQRIDAIIKTIQERIQNLSRAGWNTIQVVTDHGWLFLPNELPKVVLPQSLTDNQWGRCAALKDGALANDKMFAWFWDPNYYFTLADGINCFRKGITYAHGGLSLQECLTLQIQVSNNKETTTTGVKISDIDWRGMRCLIVADGTDESMIADIRREPGNADSSVAFNVKNFKADGTASLVVAQDELEGQQVTIVITTESGQLLAQEGTTVGGENNA
ncbi:MAG: BREX-1 system phosphatase PglZ type B, partial [Phototrophicaceae bacterium]